MIKFLYRKSRWLHKYIGLALVLFLMWMSVSGIVLNHPELVAHISIPHWLVPPAYKIKNWNRSSLIGLVYSRSNPDVLYAYGKKGVWKSEDGGKTFTPMQQGFPQSRFYLKTNHLFLWDKENPFLLAATDGGLYRAYLKTEYWQKIPLGRSPEKIKKIIYANGKLLVFSESHVYQANFPAGDLRFSVLPLKREGEQNKVTLVKLFFDLHDGKAFGLPGRLLMDVVGVLLFIVSFSGFYIWFNPWRWRRRQRLSLKPVNASKIKLLRTLVKYHLEIGIYVAIFFLILGGTGFFMRPPFLAFIANGKVSSSWYPGKLSENPWEGKIQNALIDSVRNKIVIACSDGLWQSETDFSHPFKPVTYHVPIFVMGPTYFETTRGGYMIGSFNGLFLLDPDKNESMDLITGKKVEKFSNVRPGKWMVTGYFKTPWGQPFITTHDGGVCPLKGELRADLFRVPQAMNREFTLSLWNFMFELHNGRIFQDITGKLYILIAPFGSFLFVIITLTGIFDWFYIKFRPESMSHKHKKHFHFNMRSIKDELRRKV